MFRKWFVLLVGLVLGGMASAQPVPVNVTVTVASIESFSIGETSVLIELTDYSEGEFAPVEESGGDLSFETNVGGSWKIALAISEDGDNDSHDITLSVKLGDGVYIPLLEGGVEVEEIEDLLSEITEDVLDELTWEVSASRITGPGSYVFTITFTLVDED